MKKNTLLVMLCLLTISLKAQSGYAEDTDRITYEYIAQRTIAGFDNTDIIDKYAAESSAADLLTAKSLSLLFMKNTVNIFGPFYVLVDHNADKVKKTLALSDAEYNKIILRDVDSSFEKICRTKNEIALEQLIKIRMKIVSSEDPEIIKNEYLAKYYYKTRQPLKLANSASAYADAVMHCNEGSQYTVPIDKNREVYSLKLRDAAQYVVETLSNKSMLNNALIWSLQSIEMFNCPRNYETHACILYKLGKRNEAIDSMEKAYALVKNSGEMGDVGLKLIKMKRGEKIF